MKIRRLLKKWMHRLDPAWTAREQELQSIRVIVHQLKRKERDLRERQSIARDHEERADLAAKREVVRAQRLKGLSRVRQLRAEGRTKRSSPEPLSITGNDPHAS